MSGAATTSEPRNASVDRATKWKTTFNFQKLFVKNIMKARMEDNTGITSNFNQRHTYLKF